MLNKNSDDPKYVTWADVFHPENAPATLAPQVRELHPSGHEWGAVWAEATLVTDLTPSAPFKPPAPSAPTAPIVTVVAVDEDLEQDHLFPDPSGKPDVVSPVTIPRPSIPSPWTKGNFFSTLLGGSLTIGAVSATFGLELGAAIVYLLAAAFYNLFRLIHEASSESILRPCALPVYFFCALFLTLATIFMFVDCILLLLSVFVSELLALITFLLCLLFGGCGAGAAWHQYIRKLCHLTRWAFRSFHKGWKPERGFVLGYKEDLSENNVVSTI
jgi:hypothetical protein